MCGRGEAVAGRPDPRCRRARPRSTSTPGAKNSTGGDRVVEEGHRVRALVAADRNHRRRTATGSSRPACCGRSTTSIARVEVGAVGELVQHRRRTCGALVERLRLMTSKPCSIAQSSPASRSRPRPLSPSARRTRMLVSSQSGARRPDDARAGGAVAADIALASSLGLAQPVVVDLDRHAARHRSPTAGWSGSTPESTMQTRAPAPRRATPGPLPRHRSRPARKREADSGPPQAPGRELLVRGSRGWGHPIDLITSAALGALARPLGL